MESANFQAHHSDFLVFSGHFWAKIRLQMEIDGFLDQTFHFWPPQSGSPQILIILHPDRARTEFKFKLRVEFFPRYSPAGCRYISFTDL